MVATTTATPGEKPGENGKEAKTETPVAAIQLKRLERAVLEIPIEGITPLISHAWSAKAKRMMLEAQTTRTRAKREVRNPQEDYESAFYRFPDGRPGMPATAFKASICDGARFFDGITIVSLKTSVFVKGEGSDQLVEIKGEYRMREDTARNATGVADLRYRPEFWPWSTTLSVEYLPTMLTEESVLALVDAAGRNGVGDWRPSSPKSKSGTFGQFQVVGL